MYQSGLSVFVTFMQDALKIIPIIVVVVGILRTYFFRFLFSAPAGKLADRTQKYILFIVIGLSLASLITIAAISLPDYYETSFEELSSTWKICYSNLNYYSIFDIRNYLLSISYQPLSNNLWN